LLNLRNICKDFREVFDISGLPGFFDDFQNWLGSWSLKRNQLENRQSGTSLSDIDSYNTICSLASTDAEVFKKFKSNIEYRAILEHVSRKQGSEYLNMISDREILKKISRNKIQELGRPYRYHYRGFGRISPTQLRYFKTLSDLKELFGNLDGYKIVEIGPGYGGLAQTIVNHFEIDNYALIDLPPAIELAKVYLSRYGSYSTFEFCQSSEVTTTYSDLAISNYAFSEINRSHQQVLLDNVLTKAKRGYIIFNKIPSAAHEFLTIEEICNQLPNPEVIEEIPKTGDENRLILWGHS
jgi:putative sugar O-methyltransferase